MYNDAIHQLDKFNSFPATAFELVSTMVRALVYSRGVASSSLTIGMIIGFKLKFIRKFCAINFQIVAIYRPRIRFFSFRYHFEALSEWNLIFEVVIKNALNFKSQRTKKLEFFSHGIYNFLNLGNETLFIANYEYLEMSTFAILHMAKGRHVFHKFCAFE